MAATPDDKTFPGAALPTAREIYLFDLHGFIIVRNALSADEVAQCNRVVDGMQHLGKNQWAGHVHGHDYGGKEGLNLQQIYESGPAFERLIDHPNYIAKVRHFVGGGGTFDDHHGPLFIDENFANIRTYGEAIGMHSGAHEWNKRCQFMVRNREFHCGQVNVLIALTDIGPGDGGTMVVPASHKANFPHPDIDRLSMAGNEARSMDGAEASIEVHLRKGDALMFVDAIMHGAAARVNPGQRRVSIFRYGPSWGNFRHGYRPSRALLDRLSPIQRKIVQPQNLLVPPSEIESEAEPAAAHV